MLQFCGKTNTLGTVPNVKSFKAILQEDGVVIILNSQ